MNSKWSTLLDTFFQNSFTQLMEIGDNGDSGVHALRHVMEAHRKEQESAMILHLKTEELLVMEMIYKSLHVTLNLVQLMETGELGTLGISVLFLVVEELRPAQDNVTIHLHYLEDNNVQELIQGLKIATLKIAQVYRVSLKKE